MWNTCKLAGESSLLVSQKLSVFFTIKLLCKLLCVGLLWATSFGFLARFSSYSQLVTQQICSWCTISWRFLYFAALTEKQVLHVGALLGIACCHPADHVLHVIELRRVVCYHPVNHVLLVRALLVIACCRPADHVLHVLACFFFLLAVTTGPLSPV